MQSKYCKCGHIVLGDTCSHCARRHLAALVGKTGKPGPGPGTGLNSTLVELRALKSMLEGALITEAEYDERRNTILASF